MERCFGTHSTEPMNESLSLILRRCILEKRVYGGSLNSPEVKACSILKNAGILLHENEPQTMAYTSPLAKRFIFRNLFPKRSDSDSSPLTLLDLVESVISKMSAGLLRRSTVKGKFPKETVFPHMFLNALAELTPPDCSIRPKLSELFPSRRTRILLPKKPSRGRLIFTSVVLSAGVSSSLPTDL